jgi:hypothetical protein
MRELDGRICPKHGVPANACGGMHDMAGVAMDPETTWCYACFSPAVVCGGPHTCPSCFSIFPGIKQENCGHPFHTIDPNNPKQYGQMISREGLGADSGDSADPLVQEPNT